MQTEQALVVRVLVAAGAARDGAGGVDLAVDDRAVDPAGVGAVGEGAEAAGTARNDSFTIAKPPGIGPSPV